MHTSIGEMPKEVLEALAKGKESVVATTASLNNQSRAHENIPVHDRAENRPQRRELFPIDVDAEPSENRLERLYMANRDSGYGFVNKRR